MIKIKHTLQATTSVADRYKVEVRLFGFCIKRDILIIEK